MLIDEVRDRINEDHHEHDRDDNCQDHDDKVLGKTDRRDDRVDREHQVHDHDRDDRLRQRDRAPVHFRLVLLFFFGQVEHASDLIDALIDQIDSASQQHKIAHGKAHRFAMDLDERDREDRRGHVHKKRCET